MKKLLLAVTLLFSLISYADASVYVIYKTDNNAVVSISPVDDAVLENGYSKAVLVGNMKDYPLQYDVRFYKFQNKTFVVNTNKLSKYEQDIQFSIDVQAEMKLIEKRKNKIAYDQLKAEGVVFNIINDDTFK